MRRKAILILIGLTPALMVLIAWDFGTEMTPLRLLMRGYSLQISIVETIIVLLAMQKDYSLVTAFKQLPATTQLGLLLFFLIALWTAIFVALEPIDAILGLAQILIHLMFFFAITHQFRNWTTDQHCQIWIAIGLGVIGYCILWGINIAVYRPVGNDWVWFVPAMTNVRWVGFFALAGFCAGIGVLPSDNKNRYYWGRLLFALLISTVGIGIAFWSGTRGAALAILAAAIGTSVIAVAWRPIILLTLSATFFALIGSWSLPVVHPAYGIERIIGASAPLDNKLDISNGRTELWEQSYDKIRQRPITGWGIDQFRISGPLKTIGVRHPHQGALQLLFSMGLLGVVATLMIILPFASRLFRKLSQPPQSAAWGYLFGASVYGLVDGVFYYPFPVMIFLISIACLHETILPKSATGRSDLPAPTG